MYLCQECVKLLFANYKLDTVLLGMMDKLRNLISLANFSESTELFNSHDLQK